jgi:hypothetical protein
MPRVGDIYSKPAGTTFTPNTVVESAKVNAAFDDLVQDANTARPIVAGGTGANTAVGANDKINTTSTDIASASTVNLANATGVVVNITGTTTITSLGTVASGALRTLIFGGILTLTHNATSLILPGGANITTAAGDVAHFRSKGSGNWVCVSYQKNSAGLDIPSTIHAASSKTTPVDADETALVDSAASNGLKKLTWANVKATLKTYFDTLYYIVGGTDVAVADGGTGRSSHTAYAVLCGGTTTTAAQQSIASVGSLGHVLTSNGAGALPTFQSISVDYGAGNAALGQGDVGTYAIAQIGSGSVSTGNTTAGSNLKLVYIASAGGVTAAALALSGTWRSLGNTAASPNTTLFLRVS